MDTKRTAWKKKAILDDKILGTLVLPREPSIGSKILLPGIKDTSKHSIHAEVVEIEKDIVKLTRR